METLNWNTDKLTAQVATKYCPIECNQKIPQFGGITFDAKKRERRVVQPSQWPNGSLCSSPNQIIEQFQRGLYTQALSMVISWGTMTRRSGAIWGNRDPNVIERILRECKESIQESKSVANSWRMLTGQGEGQLDWSGVITSKTLHFLCRSLGFDQNPPVAFDRAVSLNQLWPKFRNSTADKELCPEKWKEEKGHTFEAYNRYMTAIRTWVDQRDWTTTEIEATIFGIYKPSKKKIKI